jgi:hypothetical protein
MTKLYAEIVPVHQLSGQDHHRMLSLMITYYDSISLDQFLLDLSKKNAVIILRDSVQNQIQGFSTLLDVQFKTQGKIIRGAFSGDTIINQEYWGQKALGKAFLKYLWIQTIKNPFQPYYWFLISKGYKTYLLMANNFTDYYPRLEGETPPLEQEVLEQFYSTYFANHFDRNSGLIRFNQAPCKLKGGVAEITSDMLEKYPRIAFFSRKNPDWKSGTELACIARMTIGMPIKYALKCQFNRFKGLFSSTVVPQKGKTA